MKRRRRRKKGVSQSPQDSMMKTLAALNLEPQKAQNGWITCKCPLCDLNRAAVQTSEAADHIPEVFCTACRRVSSMSFIYSSLYSDFDDETNPNIVVIRASDLFAKCDIISETETVMNMAKKLDENISIRNRPSGFSIEFKDKSKAMKFKKQFYYYLFNVVK